MAAQATISVKGASGHGRSLRDSIDAIRLREEGALQGRVARALAWIEDNGRPAERIVLGGTSAGGHLAYLMTYGRTLQKAYRFPADRIVASLHQMCRCVLPRALLLGSRRTDNAITPNGKGLDTRPTGQP